MKTSKLIVALFMAAFVVGCSDDDNDLPEPVNQEEVITTMNVTLTPSSGDVVTFKSYDSDGDGPNEPIITINGPLKANTSYDGEVQLLNESDGSAKNTTEEIMEEADEHQFFYAHTGIDANFTYADTEASYPPLKGSNPVGIKFNLQTGEAGSGTISITLIHEPEKNADGVSGGDITNAAGETDFTATFPVEIQ